MVRACKAVCLRVHIVTKVLAGMPQIEAQFCRPLFMRTLEHAVSPPASDQNRMAQALVLCADLDGTLIKADLLWECIVLLLKTRPWILLMIPLWTIQGRAVLKRKLAQRVPLQPDTLPYRSDVIEFLSSQRKNGQTLVLVTAADKSLADKVAAHLGIFDEVYASEGGTNLKGRAKAELLESKFGQSGFEYLGDSKSDLAVWKAARVGHVVGTPKLVRQASSVTAVQRVFAVQSPTLKTWVRALRGHHWAKNILLFLPLILAHKVQPQPWLMSCIGFVLFGLCASSLYLLNDLLDLHSDRAHPWKSSRPLAAGETSIQTGLLVSLFLISVALGLGFLFSTSFGLILTTYALLTVWYSVQIKRVVLLDVFVLSSFYTIRIWAGGLISHTFLSQWFLAFSLFFFLSLAMAKRYSELLHAEELVKSGNSGRAYRPADRELISTLGVGSCFSSVVILSLYVHSQEILALYRRPEPLLLLCPVVLYWLSRVWLRAHRGELHEDPVTLAIRDPLSYILAAFTLIIIALSMVRLG
jgi:4-hydroxybenzoate polyprenyltransferase/phosphoserine phosphatase